MGRPLFSSHDSIPQTTTAGEAALESGSSLEHLPAAVSDTILDITTVTPLAYTSQGSERPASNLSSATILNNLANSQASLREALRVLRTTIATSNSMTSQNPASATTTAPPAPAPAPEAGMGPAHNAIVLSGTEPMADDRHSDRISTMMAELRSSPLWPRSESLRRALEEERNEVVRTLQQALNRRREEPAAATATARGTRLPESPRRAVPEHPARLLRDVLAGDRDSASTTLGRRVAARAAAGAGSRLAGTHEHGIADETTARLIEIASNLQRDISFIAERRVEMLRARWAALTPASVGRPQQETASSPTLPTASRDEVALVREYARSLRTVRAGMRPQWGSLPADRRSNASQPPTNTSTEARRNTRDAGVTTQPTVDEPTEQPSYRIRRRLNADGEEHVQNIVVDASDDDDPFSWFVPMAERERRAGRPSASRPREDGADPLLASSLDSLWPQRRLLNQALERGRADISRTADTTRQRRRGWARLDHDGNEIPTDEEEEYERTRAQMRARALALTSGQPPRRMERTPLEPYLPPPPPLARTTLQPTTQTLFWQSPGDPNVRVRLGPLPPADLDGYASPRSDEGDATVREESSELRYFGSAEPFAPSPLPLPLAEVSCITQVERRFVVEPVQGVAKRSEALVAGR